MIAKVSAVMWLTSTVVAKYFDVAAAKNRLIDVIFAGQLQAHGGQEQAAVFS